MRISDWSSGRVLFRSIVGCIAPFNFPVMVPLMMTSMAIACGNAVILKPSERVPGASAFLGKLWREAGLPNGVWNTVNGDKELVDAILDRKRTRLNSSH